MLILLFFAYTQVKAQGPIEIPEGTSISMECPLNLFAKLPKSADLKVSRIVKPGDTVMFNITENVFRNSKLLIDTNSKVLAVVTTVNGITRGPGQPFTMQGSGLLASMEDNGGGDIRVEMLHVLTPDKQTIPLSDCWIYVTAQENPIPKSKGAVLVKGTRKNCTTKIKTVINSK